LCGKEDPVIGSEQGKTRPVVIIQNDVANEYSPVVIEGRLRGEVFITQLEVPVG
jgi:mRNA interferase MazF